MRRHDREPGEADRARQPAHPPTPVQSPVLALQRTAGNAAVTRMIGRSVLARMPTTQQWADTRTQHPPPDTPYLQGVDQAFQRWHVIAAGGATQAERIEQMQVLADLEQRANALFSQPDLDYQAIPQEVRWIIMDMATDAVTERQARLGQPGYRQALHDIARAQHVTDRTQLLQWVDEGLAHPTDRRLRNSCQWVRTDPRRVRLFLLTETGDRIERLQTAGKDVDTAAALFPHPYDPSGWDLFEPVPAQVYNYSDPAAADANVYLRDDTRGTQGWNVSGTAMVILHDAIASGRDYIWETLRHEVQHDADHHGSTNIDRYKTEYRAYSYEGSPAYAALDNTVPAINVADPDNPSTVYQFTARQHAIFTAIHDGYAHTRDGWRDNPMLPSGLTFRQEVVAYVDPDTEAVNRFNSRRVDDLYRLAAQVTADGNESSPQMQALLTTCFTGSTALDRDDVLDVLEPGSAIRAHWERYIVGAARAAFLARCDARLQVPTTFHVRYYTRPGENVLVTGQPQALGGWNTGQAVHMNHSGHEDWDVTVPIPYARDSRQFEYKYFVRRDSGVEWEGGGNRRAELSATDAALRRDDAWQV